MKCWIFHNWSKWRVTLAQYASGVTESVQVRECSRCGKTQMERLL